MYLRVAAAIVRHTFVDVLTASAVSVKTVFARTGIVSDDVVADGISVAFVGGETFVNVGATVSVPFESTETTAVVASADILASGVRMARVCQTFIHICRENI